MQIFRLELSVPGSPRMLVGRCFHPAYVPTSNLPMARKAGTKNRNYPPLQLDAALKVARAIQDEASGMTISRLTLADLLDSTPSSSAFRDLVASSRFYGLTAGGINSTEFGLTPLGEE